MTAGVPALGGRRAYAVWLPAVAVYFLAVFHRSSLGVAGLAATERFDISASALSSWRSAGAVAVGPVMQGLRRPVNDLSRGATVKDIINTVAITAIQAASA